MSMAAALRGKLRSLTGTRALLLRSSVARSFSDSPQPAEPTPVPQSPATTTPPAEGEPVHFIDKIKQSLREKNASVVDPIKLSSLNGFIDIEEEDSEEPPLPTTPRDAEEIFKEMKEAGLVPNAVAMLDGLCKDGLMQEAMRLFHLMREKKSMPEVVVYTAVIDGFCKAHKFDDAIRIFRKMETNGVVPNTYSYQLLIRGLSSIGGEKRLGEAYGFVFEMMEAGHKPNLGTFVGLIDAYCKEKGVEEAASVIKAMREKGFSFEEKAAKEYMEKRGPFSDKVWDAILWRKNKPFSSFKASSF